MNVYTVTYFANGKVTTLEQLAASKAEAFWLADHTLKKEYAKYRIISVKLKESK